MRSPCTGTQHLGTEPSSARSPRSGEVSAPRSTVYKPRLAPEDPRSIGRSGGLDPRLAPERPSVHPSIRPTDSPATAPSSKQIWPAASPDSPAETERGRRKSAGKAAERGVKYFPSRVKDNPFSVPENRGKVAAQNIHPERLADRQPDQRAAVIRLAPSRPVPRQKIPPLRLVRDTHIPPGNLSGLRATCLVSPAPRTHVSSPRVYGLKGLHRDGFAARHAAEKGLKALKVLKALPAKLPTPETVTKRKRCQTMWPLQRRGKSNYTLFTEN